VLERSTVRGRISVAAWRGHHEADDVVVGVVRQGRGLQTTCRRGSTVTVSQTAKTLSSCVADEDDTGAAGGQSPDHFEERSVSCGEREAVGSSSSSTRLSGVEALAIPPTAVVHGQFTYRLLRVEVDPQFGEARDGRCGHGLASRPVHGVRRVLQG